MNAYYIRPGFIRADEETAKELTKKGLTIIKAGEICDHEVFGDNCVGCPKSSGYSCPARIIQDLDKNSWHIILTNV